MTGVARRAIRSRRDIGDRAASRNVDGGSGAHEGSPTAWPAITSRNAAASATVRARGPTQASPVMSPYIGAPETRPRLGLSPTMPQQLAGIRIEPPPSEPCATGISPADTAAAAP